MSNEQIILDDEKIYEAAKELGLMSAESSEESDRVVQNYSSINSQGVLTNMISVASNQMDDMSSTCDIARSTVEKLINQFSYDSSSADKINDIEIPQDFVATDSMQVNQFESYMLSKVDGKTVNDGQASQQVEDADESGIKEEELLADITKDNTQEKEYDDSSTVAESALGNINNEDKTQEQTYDDTSSIAGNALGNINKEAGTEEQTYDESSSINGSALKNMDGTAGDEKEYDDSSLVNNVPMNSTPNNLVSNGTAEEDKEKENNNIATPTPLEENVNNAMNNEVIIEETGDINDIES